MAKLPPFWKIRREIFRILTKSLNPFPRIWTLTTYYLSAYYYDLRHSRDVYVRPGALPEGKRVAVYLIFPSDGLLQSHLDSLNYIIRSGYTPVVVSNLPLTDQDRDRVGQLCYRYVERPNFGYDFGGYREAMKLLGYDLSRFDRLAILNDSCWFPVPGGGDWFAQAEALNVDYAGASSNYGFSRPEQEEFRTIKWDYRHDHRNFHYCSFALLVSNRLLSTRGFQKFWKRFPMTANKTRTVRRGEIGLSQWVISHGFTHGATNDVRQLDKRLESLSDERLHRALQNLVIPEEKRLSRIKKELLSGTGVSRTDIIGLILTTVARQGASYSLTDYSINDMGHAFLKKTPLYLDEDASDTTIRIVRNMPGEEGRTILSEALALRAKRAPSFAKLTA